MLARSLPPDTHSETLGVNVGSASTEDPRVDGSRVRVYVAQGCHLCEVALETVAAVCGEGFATVDITGVPELEAAYRERIPVIEVDGEVAFTYVVQEGALRALLRPAD